MSQVKVHIITIVRIYTVCGVCVVRYSMLRCGTPVLPFPYMWNGGGSVTL